MVPCDIAAMIGNTTVVLHISFNFHNFCRFITVTQFFVVYTQLGLCRLPMTWFDLTTGQSRRGAPTARLFGVSGLVQVC